MELFCVQQNVSMETGLLTVMDKLIKHSSNRNPNQSLIQWLTPAAPHPCNQPGNCFTWTTLPALECSGLLLFKALWILEKIASASLTGNFNPQHRLMCVVLGGVQPYEIGVTSVFQRKKLRLTESLYSSHMAIMCHNQNSSQLCFTPKLYF